MTSSCLVGRHRDGCWRSADEVPLSASGRPNAYIAENGHGSYPVAGTILRLFCVINDYTSSDGELQALPLYKGSYLLKLRKLEDKAGHEIA